MPSTATSSPSAAAPTVSPAPAYCPMPNHVHLVLTPGDSNALSRAVGEAHRRFTAFANARARTTGHLFQGGSPRSRWTTRIFSTRPALWRSIPSAPAWLRLPKRGRGRARALNLQGRDDALVGVGPAVERAARFADLLELSLDEQAALDGFEGLSLNGRPLGAEDFARVETKLGHSVRPGKRGRKPCRGRMD